MEWQRRHQRRVDRAHERMTKKVIKENQKRSKPSGQKDQRINQLMKGYDKYEAKQQQKAKKNINRDGNIVASQKGDTGCAVAALTVGVAVLRAWGKV